MGLDGILDDWIDILEYSKCVRIRTSYVSFDTLMCLFAC